MKRHFLAIGAITITTLLAGCDFGDLVGQHQSGKKSENSNTQTEQASNNKNSNSNNGHSSNNNEPRGRVEDLTQSQKVALAINDPSVSQYVVNASELRNHSFYANYNGGGQRKSIHTYKLEALPKKVEGAPNDMTFYTAKPSKGSFVTLIGIGNEKVLIAGTQSSGTYQQYAHLEAARELDLHELLDKYGKSSNYKNLANQITFTQGQSSNASEYTSDEGTSNNDVSNDDKVTRDNVIDKVEAYEGHQLDTDTYTFKEPEQNVDGDWGFSILDKEGNLEGSYIVTSDGEVTKYDENGEEIE